MGDARWILHVKVELDAGSERVHHRSFPLECRLFEGHCAKGTTGQGPTTWDRRRLGTGSDIKFKGRALRATRSPSRLDHFCDKLGQALDPLRDWLDRLLICHWICNQIVRPPLFGPAQSASPG